MSSCRPSASAPNGHPRRGVIVVLTAFLMVFLIGMIAFAIDLGYVVLTRTEIQAATDSAALAGAGALVNGTTVATNEAIAYLSSNKVGGRTLSSSNALVEFGQWDTTTSVFTLSNNSPNAVRVTSTNSQQPFFFAQIFGQTAFDISAEAVAIYQPRDIAIVLDYSGSMCYDSQFRNISLLGQNAVEDNLEQIYGELGSPTYGTLKFNPTSYGNSNTKNSSVLKKFKLNKVSYPYPRGSWDDYVDYVQNDSYVNSAGYRNKYGYMTFINYLLSEHCSNADTPGLWAVSEQPITALKDAVDVFLSYLTAHSTDDKVALAIYSYSDNTAILEQGLTKTYTNVSTKVRQRQAGHYTGGTNISAGMNKGRIELQNNARAGAKKMMVLITDGVVNLPTGWSYYDKKYVTDEAQDCADAGIPIVTIALGAYADTDLMQEVADISGGACFVIEGGQPIDQVQDDLESVFGQVAADRPLKLVQ